MLALDTKGSQWMLKTYAERAEAIPTCAWEMHEAGHHLHLDRPELIYKSILQFLVDHSTHQNLNKPMVFPTKAPTHRISEKLTSKL